MARIAPPGPVDVHDLKNVSSTCTTGASADLSTPYLRYSFANSAPAPASDEQFMNCVEIILKELPTALTAPPYSML
jgi:hypothetical protein